MRITKLVGTTALCTMAVLGITGTKAFADTVSPAGWTMNLPVAVVLPGGLYFADTGYYMNRQSGIGRVDAEVNLPTLVWSTPWDFLGGHVEAIAAVPELSVGDHTAGVSDTSFYNAAALIGEVWNLGSGWSVSEFAGAFFRSIPTSASSGSAAISGRSPISRASLTTPPTAGASGRTSPSASAATTPATATRLSPIRSTSISRR